MDNIIIIYIERVYCCRSNEYFKVEIEEYELRDDIIDDLFKTNKRIILQDGCYNNENYPLFHTSTKFISISKNEYDNNDNRIIDVIC